MSTLLGHYGTQIIFGIEVPAEPGKSHANEAATPWRLVATHSTKGQALNDLRWRTPNRIVEIAVTVKRAVKGPILRTS